MAVILMKHRTQNLKKITNFISDVKELIEDTKKQFSEIKDKELKVNKCLRNAQETTYTKQMKTTVTIQDLRMEFNNDIETLKRTQ